MRTFLLSGSPVVVEDSNCFSFPFIFFACVGRRDNGADKKWHTYSIDQEVFFINDILSRLLFLTTAVVTVKKMIQYNDSRMT
jgi:hypothetical protein